MIKFARAIMQGIMFKIRKLHIHNKNVELFLTLYIHIFVK